MKKPPAKAILRIVEGVLPSSGCWHLITVYTDNSIRIERPFCLLDGKREMTTIEESEAFAHRHLIGLMERTAYRDFTCVTN